MSQIDFHVHSTASDGTLTPTELVQHAKKNGVTTFALTDHDTVAAIDEALQEAAKQQITVIPGIEIGAAFHDDEMHILGLFINYQDEELKEKLKQLVIIRDSRNIKILDKLKNLGFDMSIEELQELAGGKVISRAHISKLLLKKGYVESIQEAFEKYLSPGLPGYVEKQGFSPKQVIEMILDAKGIPVLAHPKYLKISTEELEQLIIELKSYGLKGIEAIYSTYSDEEEVYYKNLAERHSLLITGGSDYHGANKPDIEMGIGHGELHIPTDLLQTFEPFLI